MTSDTGPPSPLEAVAGFGQRVFQQLRGVGALPATAHSTPLPRTPSASASPRCWASRALPAGDQQVTLHPPSGVSRWASRTSTLHISTARSSAATPLPQLPRSFSRLASLSLSPSPASIPTTSAPFASASAAALAPPPPPAPASFAPSGASSRLPSTAAEAKADLGRATWTLLHMMAAQWPDRPTRGQQRDARALVDCLTRVYPCGDCARHFAELVKREPPTVGTGPEFRRWVCRVHNQVNARLGKPAFNCDLVEARWAALDCAADGGAAVGCELPGVGGSGGGGGSGRAQRQQGQGRGSGDAGGWH